MSDFVIHKGSRGTGSFVRGYPQSVAEVTFSPDNLTRIRLANDQEVFGSCLGCSDPPCIRKAPSELALAGELEAYPGDPSLEVCPTDAIGWDPERGVASVRTNRCIGCGLCVVRCPYGAISLRNGSTAEVVTTDPSQVTVSSAVETAHPRPVRSGVVAHLSAPAVRAIPESVSLLGTDRASLLIRNLLHEAGVNARVRRRGDTNMRIDAVGITRAGRPFASEIEVSSAVLESPRALLEDIAILHARYGYGVAELDAVSIILTLPNVRSEYYQVIRDIAFVLDVKCRTVTIGSLIALIWACSRLDGFDGNRFFTGEGAVDISASLPLDALGLHEPYPGAFRPAK